MATKQIPELPATNVSNDTDLLVTRQGSSDKNVPVSAVRNLGTEVGQSLEVGGYGVGSDAIPIESLFASNNADLITRTGIYRINGAVNSPVSVGEIIHTQTSASSATQTIVGDEQEMYVRKKIAGVWQAWYLVGAANKATVRTDLDVYSKGESDGRYLDEASNLSDLPSTATARTNLDVYSKGESDSIYLNESNNLSDLTNITTARTNLNVYSKSESDALVSDVYTKSESDDRYLRDLTPLALLQSGSFTSYTFPSSKDQYVVVTFLFGTGGFAQERSHGFYWRGTATGTGAQTLSCSTLSAYTGEGGEKGVSSFVVRVFASTRTMQVLHQQIEITPNPGVSTSTALTMTRVEVVSQ